MSYVQFFKLIVHILWMCPVTISGLTRITRIPTKSNLNGSLINIKTLYIIGNQIEASLVPERKKNLKVIDFQSF